MKTPGKIFQFIKKIPKVEIHIHLEGCIDNTIIKKISPDELIRIPRKFYGLTDFVKKFLKVCSCIKRGEDLYVLTKYVLEKLEKQNTKYIELTFNPPTFMKRGICFDEVCEAVISAKKDTKKYLTINANFILDVTRKFAVQWGEEMVSKARKYYKDGIIAIGLGGDESLFPTRDSKKVFALARRYGFWTTAHCGEGVGSQSIHEALKILKVDRIEHAISLIEDEKLMYYVLLKKIPVSTCLSSNKILGFVKSISKHPFKKFYDKGILISLNTDDPGFFRTDMTKEFSLAVSHFKLEEKDIIRLTKNAIESAFLSDAEKSILYNKINM